MAVLLMEVCVVETLDFSEASIALQVQEGLFPCREYKYENKKVINSYESYVFFVQC